MKRDLKVTISFFKKINNEFAREWHQIFILGWKKCRLYGKFEFFCPGLKLHLGLVKPNCKFLHVIQCHFKAMGLLFSRDVKIKFATKMIRAKYKLVLEV